MIVFNKLTYKNFLSTGNVPNVIYLNRVPSIIITGTNGAGKSTILDALCFGLYGKPYRNINKPQLINSVNEKNLEVVIEFELNKVPYKVVRGLKPNVFEIWQNGILLNHDAAAKDYQEKLDNLIGMNQKAFTQVVILGSARYQSFMDLPSNERRIIIEEILDITVFSKMNAILKARAVDVDLRMKDNDYQKEVIKTKISSTKALVENLLNRTKESESKIIEERNKVEAQITLIDQSLSKIDSEIKEIPIIDVNDIQTKVADAKSKGKEILIDIKRLDKRISFYETNDNCHECNQVISQDTKDKQISQLTKDKEQTLNLQKLFEEAFPKLSQKLSEAQEMQSKIGDLTVRRGGFVAERKTLVNVLSSLNTRTSTADADSISEAKTLLEQHTNELHITEKSYYGLAELKNNLEICKILLKDDGIKSKIIKQYLPVMNKMINQYLDRMGASYSFNLDESFNETIKSRYRDNFTYASFSEGEKSRIALSLMMAWREIAKLKNSVNTNLLILDEVGDSSLDGEGTDVLWDLIGEMSDSNVFVISHRTSNIEKFTSHIEFYKEGNFSHIKGSKTAEEKE